MAESNGADASSLSDAPSGPILTEDGSDPKTTTDLTVQLPPPPVNKVDVLFDIDNSASMGDKQAYLTQAIPALIGRLVAPNCIDGSQPPNVNGTVVNGTCPMGFQPEFAPVTDLHLGVVTSSLGTRLSDTGVTNGAITPTPAGYVLCDPNAVSPEYPTLSAHNDDRGELITRSLVNNADGTVGDATPAGYLYWSPSGGTDPAPAITSAATLEADFGALVQGAGIYGCGIESQLESWYRFLVQPDPYETLVLNPTAQGGGAFTAGWSGVDTTILQERHDFLRPDSVVVVVVLSDENDSEIDVRSLGGTGYLFMHADWSPPHGTSACATNPDSAECFNCGSGGSDPNCTANGGVYTAPNDWGFDPNLRHVHMVQKYGVDPQYPIRRYYLGLTSTVVPDRNGEYPVANGEPAESYVGCLPSASDPNVCVPNCANPLFAASLPDKNSPMDETHLCNLPVGPRSNQKSNVFFAHIGGVPHQLLHFDPTDLSKSQLSQADWVRILGQGAANYTVGGATSPPHDYTGIDPHMIESYQDRTLNPTYANGVVDKTVTDIAPSSGAPNAPDPVSGREWITDQPAPAPTVDAQGLSVGHVLPVDRQYACTFKLQEPRDCTQFANANSCDCPADATGLTPAEIPPLCDPNNPTSQLYAKAYPTIRELTLAKLMGAQGIVSSLCPIDTQTPDGGAYDPNYGYNPAVEVIIDRLKPALNVTCLPEKLVTTSSGAAPCQVLVALPPSTGGTCKNPSCDPTIGLYGPGAATNSTTNPPLDPSALNAFCDDLEAQYANGGGTPGAAGDPANQSVCLLYQLTPSDPNGAAEFPGGGCSAYTAPNTTAAGGGGGWCYVTGAAAGTCPQAVEFSEGARPANSVAYLRCVEQ
ncbi:MAG TPA: hypothetical protein VK841_17090 [Polyangiaceae bacterium]|jgi:hypothetical protein|nr:hypothetical protein [Polyangiaceae bacterium]